ncbi:hypothetical protein VCRA2110O318_90198 [Vibrio crassostreae]|nr:hypothetical protein VCRA2117O328_100199 [Vibrio crassostreae]CAK2367889.1 hypothetical protein VCRA2110O318_90198 [Vibrio crassostreae]
MVTSLWMMNQTAKPFITQDYKRKFGFSVMKNQGPNYNQFCNDVYSNSAGVFSLL